MRDGTVTVLDESISGPGGIGLTEMRKFRVMVNMGRKTMGISTDGVSSIVRLGHSVWDRTDVSFPVAVASVNGAVIAVKDSDNGFSTWDVTTGLFIRRFVGHDDSSCTSEEKISCKCMPWLHAWPESECPAVGHRSEITAMAISHIGGRIASADATGVILVWDAGTAAVLHRITGYNPCEPKAIAFSANGLYFVVADAEGFICEFRTKDGIHVHSPFQPSQTAWSRCEMRAVAWTPDSEQYICGYERGQVKTVDSCGYDGSDDGPNGGIHLKRSEDAVNALAISPDGLSVAVAGERIIGEIGEGGRICGFVAVYNSTDNKLRWKDFATPGCDGGVTSLSFSLDGKLLVSSGNDMYVRMWDPRDGSRLKAFKQYDLPIPLRYPRDWYPQELSAPVVLPSEIICATFCVTVEDTPEKHERRLAFAQGHHKRLGVLSIIQTLSPDLLGTIAHMM
ncbi:quinon protein alcohol dehydrogenase-like superfamily [Baffinella frigidus]|nr:quinon protein alcohol dehydrogenase-like superfamily [Cryptophyta sp. CCMP2293]